MGDYDFLLATSLAITLTPELHCKCSVSSNPGWSVYKTTDEQKRFRVFVHKFIVKLRAMERECTAHENPCTCPKELLLCERLQVNTSCNSFQNDDYVV